MWNIRFIPISKFPRRGRIGYSATILASRRENRPNSWRSARAKYKKGNFTGLKTRYRIISQLPSRYPIYWGFEFVGPVDQRPLLDRDDLLVYRSQELASPMAVIGPIELDLLISSDAEDTDFIAKLCVQEPSGAITCLALGSLRCRYRDSWSDPTPLASGSATSIHLQMGHTAYVFPAGSRICLIITSSDFPRIQPHPNTMASPFSETISIPARNSILHGDTTPSRLKLPIISM